MQITTTQLFALVLAVFSAVNFAAAVVRWNRHA